MIKYYTDKSNPLEYKSHSVVMFPLLDKDIRIYLSDLSNPYTIIDACYITDDPEQVFALLESCECGEEDMYAVSLNHNTIQYIIQDVDNHVIGAIIPPESVLCSAYDSLDTVLTDYGLDIPNHSNLEPYDLTFLSDYEINHVI